MNSDLKNIVRENFETFREFSNNSEDALLFLNTYYIPWFFDAFNEASNGEMGDKFPIGGLLTTRQTSSLW